MDEKDDGEGVYYHDDEEKDNACEKDDIDGEDEDEDVNVWIHPHSYLDLFQIHR